MTAPENFQIFTVKVEPAGLQYDVEGDLTLLEAAEMSRIELPQLLPQWHLSHLCVPPGAWRGDLRHRAAGPERRRKS